MPASNNTNDRSPAVIPDYLIRRTTLRQLQVFEAIFRLGSFTRAAEELHLTQPTVSMQIRKLADAIGLPLFEHVGRSVESTEAGIELYDSCRRIFEILSHLEMKVADLKGLKRGRLRMGVVTTAKYLAPEMLAEFGRMHPGIDLALKVSNRHRIIERMHANEDDLYIMGQAPEDGFDIEAYAFSPNPLVVMASRDHPLVNKKNINLEEIANEPFIMREPGSGIRDLTLRTFNAKGLRPNIRIELGSNEAIKHAVASNIGLSVLSLHSLALEGVDGQVAILDVEGFPILRTWYIVYPKGKELSLVARTFLEFAISYEPIFRERVLSMLPGLKDVLNNSKNKPIKKKEKTKIKRKRQEKK